MFNIQFPAKDLTTVTPDQSVFVHFTLNELSAESASFWSAYFGSSDGCDECTSYSSALASSSLCAEFLHGPLSLACT